MSRTKSPLPPALARAAQRLDEWRSTRTTRVISPDLWRRAAKLASRHGVSPVARALRLDFYEIKRRLAATRTPRPFVEIVPAAPHAARECRVEFEDAQGVKMRVAWDSGAAPDVEALARLFLGRRG